MNIENKLEQLIKGKKVAIVGPAEYVCKELDDTHGSYLDNYDVVIRLNSFFYCPEELKKYYGSKYDIISSAFWHRCNNDFKDPDFIWKNSRYCIEEEYNRLNEGTILLECYARNEFHEIYRRYKKTIDSNKLIYGNISGEKYYQVVNLLKNIYPITKTPTTGFATIGLILSFQPRKLYITGITAYQETPYKTHFDGYSIYPDEDKRLWDGNYNGKTYNTDGKEDEKSHHNFMGEAYIMKYLIENKFVKVDKYMKNLFKNFN
jgi:hypothetical protein